MMHSFLSRHICRCEGPQVDTDGGLSHIVDEIVSKDLEACLMLVLLCSATLPRP